MDHNIVVKKALECGAMHAHAVDVGKIRFYPELRELCVMNSCGCYGTTWGCPPGCGEVADLAKRAGAYENGVVYQYIGTLEDSFDFDGMMACGDTFSAISLCLRDFFCKTGERNVWVLGAGKCSLCDPCAYPDAPCRFPVRKNISVEACGINVSELCALSGLKYINGPNTVTNTGLVLFS